MIMESVSTVNDHIAERVRGLRLAQDLSLDALAARCGVSRSMISLIERGTSSPTAVLLEKLATGLNVPLASLFESPRPAAEPLVRAADQLSWRDPGSGYVRRNVSPAGTFSPIQIVEVSFPPKARVAYETAAREVLVHQQVWMLEGSLSITVGEDQYRLDEGDCLAMILDRPIMYYNPTRKRARYAVVLTSETSTGR